MGPQSCEGRTSFQLYWNKKLNIIISSSGATSSSSVKDTGQCKDTGHVTEFSIVNNDVKRLYKNEMYRRASTTCAILFMYQKGQTNVLKASSEGRPRGRQPVRTAVQRRTERWCQRASSSILGVSHPPQQSTQDRLSTLHDRKVLHVLHAGC